MNKILYLLTLILIACGTNQTNSDNSFICNSPVAHGIFLLTNSQMNIVKKSRVVMVSFKLEDNLTHTYEAKKDSDALMNQSRCL